MHLLRKLMSHRYYLERGQLPMRPRTHPVGIGMKIHQWRPPRSCFKNLLAFPLACRIGAMPPDSEALT